MRIDTRSAGDGTVLRIEGEIDLQTSPRLHEALRRVRIPRGAAVTVDLSGVERLDSSGVATLLEGLRRARRSGGDLRVTGPSDRIRRVLRLSGVEDLLSGGGAAPDPAEPEGGR
jgi:anti-sigma B factor antagonist